MEIKNRLSSVLHTGPQREIGIPQGKTALLLKYTQLLIGLVFETCLFSLLTIVHSAHIGHPAPSGPQSPSVLGAVDANDLTSVPLPWGLLCLA